MKASGKISTFGGPADKGVSPSEGLAIFEPQHLRSWWETSLFLGAQPSYTTGLARRLNPEAFYCAMRWDYAQASKEQLRHALVKVTNLKTQKVGFARPADWGPHGDTDRIVDLSPGIATYLGLQTDESVECELVLLPYTSPVERYLEPTEQVSKPIPAEVSTQFQIDDNGWIVGVKRDLIAGGAPMPARRCLIEHFTGGATGASSIEHMRREGLSAHLVVERDGTIYQCRSFKVTCGHAGPPGKSRWVDPNTGKKYDGLNSCSIGIEIANAGNDPGALSWARKQSGFQSIRAKHQHKGGAIQEWEVYYPKQLAAVRELSKVLKVRYNLDDVTGHDYVAPERKDDAGPAFPMQEIREYCGLKGLPVVHQK